MVALIFLYKSFIITHDGVRSEIKFGVKFYGVGIQICFSLPAKSPAAHERRETGAAM